MLQLTYTFTVHPAADFAKLGATLAALHAIAAGPTKNPSPAPAAPVPAAPAAAPVVEAPADPLADFEAPAAPKRGRGRPPKPKLVESGPAVPDAIPPSVPATVATAATEPAKVFTLDDLKLAMRKFLERDKIERCKELFAKHGFTKLHEIPADKFGVLITELNNALPAK